MSSIFKYSGAGAVESQEPEPLVFGVLEPEPPKCDGSATLPKSIRFHILKAQVTDLDTVKSAVFPMEGEEPGSLLLSFPCSRPGGVQAGIFTYKIHTKYCRGAQ